MTTRGKSVVPVRKTSQCDPRSSTLVNKHPAGASVARAVPQTHAPFNHVVRARSSDFARWPATVDPLDAV
eukprot:gene11144-9719_t